MSLDLHHLQLTRALEDVLSAAAVRLGLDVHIAHLDEEQQLLRFLAATPGAAMGAAGDEAALASTFCLRMASGRGEPVVQDVRRHLVYAEAADALDLPVRSYAGVAIPAGRLPAPVSICATSRREDAVDDRTLASLQALASRLGRVLEQLHDTLGTPGFHRLLRAAAAPRARAAVPQPAPVGLATAEAFAGLAAVDLHGRGVGTCAGPAPAGEDPVRWLLVRPRGAVAAQALVPAAGAVAGGGRLWLPWSRERIRRAPGPRRDGTLGTEVLAALAVNYGLRLAEVAPAPAAPALRVAR